jgi:hypothetical protein
MPDSYIDDRSEVSRLAAAKIATICMIRIWSFLPDTQPTSYIMIVVQALPDLSESLHGERLNEAGYTDSLWWTTFFVQTKNAILKVKNIAARCIGYSSCGGWSAITWMWMPSYTWAREPTQPKCGRNI